MGRYLPKARIVLKRCVLSSELAALPGRFCVKMPTLVSALGWDRAAPEEEVQRGGLES